MLLGQCRSCITAAHQHKHYRGVPTEKSWLRPCNAYAGERQLYSSDTDQVALNRRLDNELTVMVNWFRENGLMANPNKFQTMVLGSKK